MADARINHQDARDYWEGIDADVNGMLGGFPYISKVDLQGSKGFLVKLGVVKKGKKIERVADCGAGIGRITNGLLLSIANTVDIVEPIKKFTDALSDTPGIGEIFNTGLEDWDPIKATEWENEGEKTGNGGYDLIWNQWCVGHLTDEQLVAYLIKCGTALREGEKGVEGYIIVKENLSTDSEGDDIFDDVDSSVTRTDDNFKKLFEKAGLVVKKTQIQNGLPKELYPVRIYALQPKASSS